MYDHEKGYMVFRDQSERLNWEGKCIEIVMKEYDSENDSINKWKKDGERFLKEDFIYSPAFPYLNDGRPELLEWLQGTYSSGIFIKTGIGLDEICEFLESMSQIYSSHGLESFAIFIDAIVTDFKLSVVEYEYD